MKLRGIKFSTAIVIPFALQVGCWQAPQPTPDELQTGMIWMVPGVYGSPSMLREVHRALRKADVESAIRTYNWYRPELFGSLANLADLERNRSHAADIAEAVAAYAAEYEGRPIDLIGYSGGGGLVIMTAEALPDDVRLRHIILVHPALSPDYDLTPALAHIDGSLIHFHSPLDWYALGAGTTIFGTIDRRYTTSAGKNGFDLEAAVADPALRARVDQQSWKPEMLWKGHYGGHLGGLGYSWNVKYLAPYLLVNRPPQPTDEPSADTSAAP